MKNFLKHWLQGWKKVGFEGRHQVILTLTSTFSAICFGIVALIISWTQLSTELAARKEQALREKCEIAQHELQTALTSFGQIDDTEKLRQALRKFLTTEPDAHPKANSPSSPP